MAIYLSKPAVICAAGNSVEELWQSVIKGNQDGIKKVKTATNEEYFAARISDTNLEKSTARYDMRIMKIEEAALTQISEDIDFVKNRFGSDRVAVCIGSCDNGTEFSVSGHKKYFLEGKFPEDYSLEIQGADYVATFISEKYGLKGPSNTFSTACSSSASAIIKGAEMLMADLADAVVVGGIDIASDTVLIGFNSLEAVSSEITNPFSKNRHGITLGEAGVFFILTKSPIEDKKIWDRGDRLDSSSSKSVQLLGWGESADAYHMTSPDPSGAGAEKAMKRALESAGIKPCDVDYVNMHGTGTKFNDSMEAKAINAVFGDYKVPVSTTKPVTGHTLGAAGALEAAICYSSINNVELPQQVWDGEQDSELPELNIVKKGYKSDKKTKICLSNSFAFGGANACLVIGVR